MAHLITHHDPFHVHKILGLAALLHFIFRLWLLVTTGVAFPPTETLTMSIACVLLHGFLSWSSLLLPLTARRLYTKPMIWPEFRLHSILFASRHVVGTVICLCGAWALGATGAPGSPLAQVATLASRLFIVLGTTATAKAISDWVGDSVSRTTNAMPYPAATSPSLLVQFKSFYANAQFHATVQAVCGDTTMAFVPLYAIQGAPFLMTLVRKGKGGARMYHIWYTLTLMVPYAAMAARLLLQPSANAMPFVVRALAGRLAIELRIYKRWSTYATWTASLVALSAMEAVVGAAGWHLSGPLTLAFLCAWAVRAQLSAVEDKAAGLAKPAGEDKAAGLAKPAGEDKAEGGDRYATSVHTPSANPFVMFPAMLTVWKQGGEEEAAKAAAGGSDSD